MTLRHIGPSAQGLRIEWTDGLVFELPYLDVRFACPCAACVDEHTGQRIVEKQKLMPDVRPLSASLVGRYAVEFAWSDGHRTGIYDYTRLRQLCESGLAL